MTDKNLPGAATAAPTRPSKTGDVFDLYLREDDEDRRSLRYSILVAVLVHIGLLAVTLPAMSGPVIPEPEAPKVFFVSPPPRFKPKPPPPPDHRVQQAVAIPMPDETPHDEEPLRLDEPTPEPVALRPDPIDVAIPDAPPTRREEPIVVGSGVERPERIHYVDPLYPEVARRVRAEGLVILDTIIDKSGHVKDLKVLKTAPFGLTEAAVDAVKQWRYRPSAMNGKPVEVRMTVTVIFNID